MSHLSVTLKSRFSEAEVSEMLLDCPYCDSKPVKKREGAKACSPKCRKRKQRLKELEGEKCKAITNN